MAARKTPAKKTAKKTATVKKSTAPKNAPKPKKKAAGINHKSPEAAAARVELDKKLHSLLNGAEAKREGGLSRAAIASKLGVDAAAAKASVNRLIKAGCAKNQGTTMDSRYLGTGKALPVKGAKGTKGKPAGKASKPVDPPRAPQAGPAPPRGKDEEE